jgi:pimeloyl-ACP methyl ester carboxylesterase
MSSASPAAGYRPATTGVALSTAPLPALPPADAPPLPLFPGTVQRVGNLELFVRRATGGPNAEPALYVHGLGGASTNWTDLMALLAGRLDGQALDLPGFGQSGPPPNGNYGLGTHVRAVIGLLDSHGGTPVHLFGNSLGGAVCTRVAATRPDLVKTLTLISPALPNLDPRGISDPRLPLILLPGVRRVAQRRLNALDARQRALGVLKLCYYDVNRVAPQRLEQAADEVRRRTGLAHNDTAFAESLRGLIRSYLLAGPGSLWRQAARVRVPTLLVWGRHDRLVNVSVAARALATFPNARLLVLEDCGHVAQMEHPETVARAVLGLLDG